MTVSQKYMNKLEGDRVLIIGGSSGVGYGIAEACVEFGCNVFISASSEGSANRALGRLTKAYPSAQDRITATSCDLADEDTLDENLNKLFETVTGSGQLDHIVFTAGDKITPIPIQQLSVSNVRKAGSIRFVAALLVAKYALMKLNPGPKSSYTIISGGASQRPTPNWSATSSYLAGTHGMARNLAFDMKPVRVNVVELGGVDTEMWTMEQAEKDKFLAFIAGKNTTGKIGQVEDVVETYIGVLKDRNCTGAILSSHGGFLLT